MTTPGRARQRRPQPAIADPTGRGAPAAGGRAAPDTEPAPLRPVPAAGPAVSRRRAVAAAVASVVGAAALGQLATGDDPGATLDSLPHTPLSVPIQAWIAVAVVYYGICGTIVFRLTRAGRPARVARRWYLGLMAANELWNYLLFGFDRLQPALLGMLGFAVLTIHVARVLRGLDDRVPFGCFVPYVAWVVCYDVPWIIASAWA